MTPITTWLIHSALGPTVLLLATACSMCFTRQPCHAGNAWASWARRPHCLCRCFVWRRVGFIVPCRPARRRLQPIVGAACDDLIEVLEPLFVMVEPAAGRHAAASSPDRVDQTPSGHRRRYCCRRPRRALFAVVAWLLRSALADGADRPVVPAARARAAARDTLRVHARPGRRCVARMRAGVAAAAFADQLRPAAADHCAAGVLIRIVRRPPSCAGFSLMS